MAFLAAVFSDLVQAVNFDVLCMNWENVTFLYRAKRTEETIRPRYKKDKWYSVKILGAFGPYLWAIYNKELLR